MSYKSKYCPINKEKYKGNPDNICCRSLWERWLAKFLDHSSMIEWWSSEELIINYFNINDKRWHRYFPDFVIKLISGKTLIIEVKPEIQTKPPINKSKKKYIAEMYKYKQNLCKWKFAQEFANSNGYEFHVWTEKTLKKMGMRGI